MLFVSRQLAVFATNFRESSSTNLRARRTRQAKYSRGSQGKRIDSTCCGGATRKNCSII